LGPGDCFATNSDPHFRLFFTRNPIGLFGCDGFRAFHLFSVLEARSNCPSKERQDAAVSFNSDTRL
jgi:hypothetical protein